MRVGLTFERKSDFTPPPGAPPDAAAEMEPDYTIEELGQTVASHGHEVVLMGNARQVLAGAVTWRERVDLVFNYSVGYGGRARETWIPAILDLAGLPYVGGDAVCLGIASDKFASKALARSLGVATPDAVLLDSLEAARTAALPPFPLILKPAYEGSSIGIGDDAVVRSATELEVLLARLLRVYRQPVVAERFIAGREATVALLGDPLEPFGIVGVAIDGHADLGERFLSNTLKGNIERTAGLIPSGLSAATEARMREAAVRVARAIGARDYCRCDFRIGRDGTPYFLEVNPIPQLAMINGEFSLIAESKGLGYRDVIGRILASAMARHGLKA